MKVFALTFVLFFIAATSSFAQCPTIAVVGPTGLTNPGDNVTFRAEVGLVGPKLEYFWTVSAGTIVEGQGTSQIRVVTDKSMGGTNVIGTVEIGGLPAGCKTSASARAPIDQPPEWCWNLSEYGRLKPNEERSHLDNFFAELSNNPTAIGLILLRITPKEIRGPTNPRIQFVLRHAKFRKFDRTRLWFALELAGDQSTVPVRMPPGGEMPPCDQCLVIKAADIL